MNFFFRVVYLDGGRGVVSAVYGEGGLLADVRVREPRARAACGRAAACAQHAQRHRTA